MERKMKTT